MKPLRLGLTKQQHASMRHPIDAIVNARGGLHHLNDFDVQEEIEMQRDANKVRDYLSRRVTIHQFNSRHFRRSPIANMAVGWNRED